MSAKLQGIIPFLMAIGSTSAAYANEVVIPASNDATLFGGSDASGNKSGSGPGLFVGTDGTPSPKRSLIEFNIASSVPAGATITSTSLTLYLGMVAGAGSATSGTDMPETINLHTVSDPWHGGTNGTTGATSISGSGHGANPHTGDATWNYSIYSTVPWTTPGGDFSSAMSSSYTDGSTWTQGEAYTWTSASYPLMVTNVQSWLNGTTTNNGWLLQNTDETDPTTFRVFYSAEGASELSVPTYAPELTVDYTPAPEPAAAFIFLAAPLLLRRRRLRTI